MSIAVEATDDGIIPWLLAGVASVIATLVSVVAYLFRLRESENAKAIAELRESNGVLEVKAAQCEADRSHLFAKCEVMSMKVDVLEKRIELMDKDGTKYGRSQNG